MAPFALIGQQIEDGGRLVADLRRGGFAVRVAYWAYKDESEQWLLYLVSDEAARGASAFHDVHAAARRLDSPWLEPFDVTLVRPSERPARALEAYLAEYPLNRARVIRGQMIGDVYFHGAYIYPPEPAPPPVVDAPEPAVGP